MWVIMYSLLYFEHVLPSLLTLLTTLALNQSVTVNLVTSRPANHLRMKGTCGHNGLYYYRYKLQFFILLFILDNIKYLK